MKCFELSFLVSIIMKTNLFGFAAMQEMRIKQVDTSEKSRCVKPPDRKNSSDLRREVIYFKMYSFMCITL